MSKDRLEEEVFRRIQKEILTEQNVRLYVNLVFEQEGQNSQREIGAEEKVVSLNIADRYQASPVGRGVRARVAFFGRGVKPDQRVSFREGGIATEKNDSGAKSTLCRQDPSHSDFLDGYIYQRKCRTDFGQKK